MALPSCEKCGDAADVVPDGKRWRCTYGECNHGLDENGSVIPPCSKCGDYQDVEVSAPGYWRCAYDEINIDEAGREMRLQPEGLLTKKPLLLPSRADVSKAKCGKTPCWVYYMATLRNASNIVKWGLLAHKWATLLPERDDIADTGAMDQYGRREHYGDANLYFGVHTPMQHVLFVGQNRTYSEGNLAILRFDADAMFQKNGVQFSDGNVANWNTRTFSARDDSGKLNTLVWSIVLCAKRAHQWGEEGIRKKMAEIHVPNYIPPDEIESVIVLNNSAKTSLEELISSANSEEFLTVLSELREGDASLPITEQANTNTRIFRDSDGDHFFSRGDGDRFYGEDEGWDAFDW